MRPLGKVPGFRRRLPERLEVGNRGRNVALCSSTNSLTAVNRPTRTQSVQARIISETHSTLLQRGGRGKGAAAPFPAPQIPADPASASLRTSSGQSRLTIPNTYSTITMPASLRLRRLFTFTPECRSACLRNRCSPPPEYPACPSGAFRYHRLCLVLIRSIPPNNSEIRRNSRRD